MIRKVTIVGFDGTEDTAPDSPVRAKALAGAISKPVQVRVREPQGAACPTHSLSGQPFEIVAGETEDGPAVKHLDTPVTVKVEYDPELVRGDEESLTLFAYD